MRTPIYFIAFILIIVCLTNEVRAQKTDTLSYVKASVATQLKPNSEKDKVMALKKYSYGFSLGRNLTNSYKGFTWQASGEFRFYQGNNFKLYAELNIQHIHTFRITPYGKDYTGITGSPANATREASFNSTHFTAGTAIWFEPIKHIAFGFSSGLGYNASFEDQTIVIPYVNVAGKAFETRFNSHREHDFMCYYMKGSVRFAINKNIAIQSQIMASKSALDMKFQVPIMLGFIFYD